MIKQSVLLENALLLRVEFSGIQSEQREPKETCVKTATVDGAPQKWEKTLFAAACFVFVLLDEEGKELELKQFAQRSL